MIYMLKDKIQWESNIQMFKNNLKALNIYLTICSKKTAVIQEWILQLLHEGLREKAQHLQVLVVLPEHEVPFSEAMSYGSK